MKGEQANYNISLAKAFLYPPKKRIIKAIGVIKKFAKKHTRAKTINISNEVNEYLHKNSKNLPRKVNAILLKENDKITIFMQNGKELKTYLKKREEEKKKKEEKKEEQKKEKSEKEETDKIKLEEKKKKEEAAEAAQMKRKTNK
jgi:ribosomal protein L31E